MLTRVTTLVAIASALTIDCWCGSRTGLEQSDASLDSNTPTPDTPADTVANDGLDDVPALDSRSEETQATQDSAADSEAVDVAADVDASHGDSGDGDTSSADASDSCGPPPQWATCGGRCVDLFKDSNNCGQCGRACLPDLQCANGGCRCGPITGCAPRDGWSLSPCPVDGGVACTALGFDPDNCGGCGIRCPSSARCCTDGGCADLHGATFSSGCGTAELCP